MDANRDFLFKISNIEQGMGKAAVDFSTKAAAGDKEFQKGMALARDVADVTAGRTSCVTAWRVRSWAAAFPRKRN